MADAVDDKGEHEAMVARHRADGNRRQAFFRDVNEREPGDRAVGFFDYLGVWNTVVAEAGTLLCVENCVIRDRLVPPFKSIWSLLRRYLFPLCLNGVAIDSLVGMGERP